VFNIKSVTAIVPVKVSRGAKLRFVDRRDLLEFRKQVMDVENGPKAGVAEGPRWRPFSYVISFTALYIVLFCVLLTSRARLTWLRL